MKFSIQFVYILSLIFSSVASAEVNLQTGGYVRRFTDYRVQWKNQDIIVERVYRSRQIFTGFFGTGWCSFFDEKIEFTAKTAEIHFCADELTLVLSARKKNVWEFQDWKLIKTLSGYHLEKQNKGQRDYSSEGWLNRFDKNIEIFRDSKGLPQALYIGLVKFDIDTKKQKITQISSNHQSKTIYKYLDDQLVEVLQNDVSLQRFFYDEDDNLTEIKKSNATVEKIKYDKNQDRVLEIHVPEACEKIYQYDMLNSTETVTRVLQNCKSKISTLAEVHFWYEASSIGKVNLVKFETTSRTLASENRTKNNWRKK